jgi:hypothetical protein
MSPILRKPRVCEDCKQGYVPTSNRQRFCLACRSLREAPKRIANHCRKGHELTPENTAICTYRDGRIRRQCRICKKNGYKIWRDKNREYLLGAYKRRRIAGGVWSPARVRMYRYGLTPERYQAMFSEQGGMCKLRCGRAIAAVDHDHCTNLVRGLLCKPCNAALGLLKDDPLLMERAAEYIRRSNANTPDH